MWQIFQGVRTTAGWVSAIVILKTTTNCWMRKNWVQKSRTKGTGLSTDDAPIYIVHAWKLKPHKIIGHFCTFYLCAHVSITFLIDVTNTAVDTQKYRFKV